MADVERTSVIVPTIGRMDLLRACLASLDRCDPRAEEIVVVDQSDGDAVVRVVQKFGDAGARVVASAGRGIARAMNEGIRAARNETVLVTHDDCTVAVDWVGHAARLMRDDPEQIVTGRVVPAGEPESIPSAKDDPTPEDFTAESYPGVLWPANMAVGRSRILDFGGFDERFTLAAEDTDLSYRWLRSGRRVRYRPEMVVWHHDWRTSEDLKRTYRSYHRAQGQFYAKHLRKGDLRMLRYLALEFVGAVRFLPDRLRKVRTGRVDRRHGVWLGVLAGLVRGWRMYSPRRQRG
jgi:GT2 family glycosyltransferase